MKGSNNCPVLRTKNKSLAKASVRNLEGYQFGLRKMSEVRIAQVPQFDVITQSSIIM